MNVSFLYIFVQINEVQLSFEKRVKVFQHLM